MLHWKHMEATACQCNIDYGKPRLSFQERVSLFAQAVEARDFSRGRFTQEGFSRSCVEKRERDLHNLQQLIADGSFCVRR